MPSLKDQNVVPGARDDATVAVAEFKIDLKGVRRLAGNPSYDTLANLSGHVLSKSTIIRALKDDDKLPSWRVVEQFLQVCGVSAANITWWRTRWAEVMNTVDPLADTAFTRTSEPDQSLSECPTCGALITNTARHAEWHEMFVPKQAQPTGERTANVRRLFGQAG
jgi:hypothetical protein